MNHTPRSGVIIRQEERRAEVARMRREGATLEAIAAALDVSSRTVRRDLDRLLSGVRDDQVSEVAAWRTDALDDLRALSERMWIELDRDPTPQAVAALAHALVKTIERCSSLLGLDAPQRHVITAGAPDITDADAIEQLAKLPPRALERIRSGLHAETDERIDRALALRLESDAAHAERIADARGDVPEVPEVEDVPEVPAEPDPVPEDVPPPPIVLPALDRGTQRLVDRQLARSAEVDAAVASFKRANSVTPEDAQ